MIGGILLAAGQSTRMGRNKLLLPHLGYPLAAHALSALAASKVSPVICVLGWEADTLREALGQAKGAQRVRYVLNEGYTEGRASSIRKGLEALPPHCEAALFLPADLPMVTAEDIDRVVEEYERTRAPVVVVTDPGGKRTHPVLFAKSFFPKLMALKGDRGGRDLILLHWESAAKVIRTGPNVFDVDTPEDYQRLVEMMS